jgi:hypothetical protein
MSELARTKSSPNRFDVGLLYFAEEGQTTYQLSGELADKARRAVANHPVMRARYGPNVQIDKYWLVFQYPYRPFPVFRRQGFVFTNPYFNTPCRTD